MNLTPTKGKEISEEIPHRTKNLGDKNLPLPMEEASIPNARI
jgi:hypothetical protein